MFLKKVLNQPNLVGSMLITLMVCGGLVYAVGFDGFNVETATGGEVEAWLEAANGGGSGNSYTCDNAACGGNGNANDQYSGCPARKGQANCTGCSRVRDYCKKGCSHAHTNCHTSKGCPHANKRNGGCSKARNSKTDKTQTTCPSGC